MAFEGDTTERRLTLGVAHVGSSTCLKKNTHCLGMAVVSGEHQQRIALVVGRVDGKSARKERGDFGGAPLAGVIGGQGDVGGCWLHAKRGTLN